MWTKGEEPPPTSLDKDESSIESSAAAAAATATAASSSSLEMEKYQDNPNELIDYKDIMLKNQFDLKKKQEEVQEYAEKLTKIKSKVKLSRRSVDTSLDSSTVIKKNDDDNDKDNIDDDNDDEIITDEKAKTPKAKSHLLRKKLAENRRVFEQRNKKLSENKRAVEEKVEEIRQQINETDLSIEKDKRFIELNDKINELQATIIDLQDNLKEKDSVIDSKTRAITLMSEDLSKKRKITLDNLEETKTEMRLMQENFIQLEASLKTKIEHLIKQLNEKEENIEKIQFENESMNLINKEKDEKIYELEEKTNELMNSIVNKQIESNVHEEYDDNIDKLKRELDESNKHMIKMKAQHKSKLKNLQKRLDNYRTMSDANAEVIRLENQVTLLEEEKVSNEELNRQIKELETTTITQNNEIQMHIEAIGILENQKLDLIQELHGLKQEMSALENENADSENSRVTAELKIVELEEQLERLNNKKNIESGGDDNNTIQLINDNTIESEKNEGIDKKSTDSTGSNESFERIMEGSDGGIAVLTSESTNIDEISKLNEKLVYLTQENNELVIKLTKLEEKMIDNDNCRDKLNKLIAENDELIINNRDNFVDKDTLMSLESEIDNLKVMINEKHEENEKLMNNLTLNDDNYQQMKLELMKKMELLELNMANDNSKIKSMENIIDEKNRLIQELENKKSENDDEINELNENKYKMNELIESKINYYTDLERGLRNAIEQLESKVKNDENTIDQLNDKINNMQIGLEQKNILIDELTLDKINLTSKFTSDSEQLMFINSNLNREIDEFKDQNNLLINEKINNLQIENENYIREINDLKVNNEFIKEKIDNLESENRNYTREIDEKNIEIHNLKMHLDKIINDNSEHVKSLETMFKDINGEIKERNDYLELELKKINDEIEYYREELKQKDEHLQQLKINNEDNLNNNVKLNNQIHNLTIDINNLNSIIDNKDEIIKNIIDEKTNLEIELKKEININIEKLLAIESSYNELEKKSQQVTKSYKELSNQMEIQLKYHEDIKNELSNADKMIEQLKIKHQDDIYLLNKRLETLIIELNDKTKESDELKIVIDEKEKIIGDNVTSEVKITLEERICWLERQLDDANSNIQSHLHKMKIIAANLIKKSGQCQEFEVKIRELEENLMIEKHEKDELNRKIQSLNKLREDNEEMIDKMSSSLNNAELIIQNEKAARAELSNEFEGYKEHISIEIMEKDRELSEVKETARELNVRMQVMEQEYLEQLNIINKSQTEHRLLLSKLSHVNELFDNTKIELDKLKNNYEQLQLQNQVIKQQNFDEINDKLEVINQLSKEKNEIEVRLTELLSELELFKDKNDELTVKYRELLEKYENNFVEHDKQVSEVSETSSLPVAEILFDASKCFGTNSSTETNVNEEILMLKQLLNDTKNEKNIIEDKYKRLNEELNELKVQIDNLTIENEKNKMKIDDNEISETIKLDDDDEEWSWNAKEAEISNIEPLQPFSTSETQLNVKIAELEDTIKDLNDEKIHFNDEIKLIQNKNSKLIKKLKEYKIQNDSLQQQLKIQLSSGGLCDLDSAIEEELKSQVLKLENMLQEVKNDNEKISMERDNCLKRIDVLIAANEHFTDIKERQDRDLEVMYIRNNELMQKIQLLNDNVNNKNETVVSNDETIVTCSNIDSEECDKCKGRVLEMQESLEMLSVENDELRRLIELEKNKLTEKINEIQVEKIQSTEELKVKFYDMLEKSHNIEKHCVDTLEESKQETVNIEENYRANLINANEKIKQLEMDINDKTTIIQNHEVTIENYREELKQKIEQLDVANKQMNVIEINIQNEMTIKQNEIDLLQQTIDNLRLDKNNLIDELTNAKMEIENNNIALNDDINSKKLVIQNLEDNLKISGDKIIKQTEELFEMQKRLEEMRLTSEKNLTKLQQLEQKCLANLQNANEENLMVKQTHDLFVEETNEKAREFDKEIAISRDKMAEQNDNIKLMENNLKMALEESEKYRLSYQDIEQKILEVNDNLSTVTELLNVRVQEVADLKQYIQKLEFDKLELDNCRLNINELNDKLMNRESDITSKIGKYEFELNEKSQEIIKLQSKLTILNVERDENNLQLDNQAQEIKLLKETLNNSQILIEKLNSEINIKNNEIIQVQMKITNYNDEMQRLVSIINEFEIKLSKRSEEIEQLQGKISELISLNEQENEQHKSIGKQLTSELSAKNEEIEDLKYILDESTYPAIIQQLQNKIDALYEEKSQLEQSLLPNLKNLSDIQAQNAMNNEQNQMSNKNTNELDIALYMLHQRDVRCEELTHELMQLLEERDTLQLRLSNAIRVTEELRTVSALPESLKNLEKKHDTPPGGYVPPAAVQDTVTGANVDSQTSTTTSQLADSDEEKKMLALKLSQLRNVGHRKDIRLLDERELRNTQQMSLIAHKDALSTLPPDAAARLINANYTLSRDVQSQSSVLLNWLWGKSTPKVVHM